MLHNSNSGGTRKPGKSSTKSHKEAGSGSRPVKSRHAIETSAPKNAHGLDRPSGVKPLA